MNRQLTKMIASQMITKPWQWRNFTTEERFWAQIECDPNGGCWLWSGSSHKSTQCQRYLDYGSLRVDGKITLAHRFSYALHNGDIPQGKVVMHTCDVSACVNPSHLRLGTRSENNGDRDLKGRHWSKTLATSPTERKLVADDVRYIRENKDRLTMEALAVRYGITLGWVWSIVNNKCWKRVN